MLRTISIQGAGIAPRLRLRFVVMLAGSALVAGCQTDGSAPPKLSLDEAKQVTATFEGPSFTPPPRTISDILSILNEPIGDNTYLQALRAEASAEPPATDDKIQLSRFYGKRGRAVALLGQMKQAIEDLELSLEYVQATGQNDSSGRGVHSRRVMQNLMRIYFQQGDYASAIEHARELVRLTPSDRAGQVLINYTFLAWFLASVGDFEGAESALARARSRVHETYEWTRGHGREWGPATRLQVPNHEGQILLGRGRYAEAEAILREALGIIQQDIAYGRGSNVLSSSSGASLSEARIRTKSAIEVRLAKALRGQDRLAEAEIHARSALKSFLGSFGRHSDRTAFALSELTRILIEQGRFEEAEQLARVTVEIFQDLGAENESLTLAESRSILADSLMGRSRWAEAVIEFEKIERSLASDPAIYQRIFARNPNRALAFLMAGRIQEALHAAKETSDRATSFLGIKHYESAEARGILAMAYLASDQPDQAFLELESAIPILLQRSRASDDERRTVTARDQRLRLIVETYINLLVKVAETETNSTGSISAVSEAFRLADRIRAKTVQRALRASSARASANDPELADLVRREQDAQMEIGALYGLLANLLSAPAGQRNEKNIQELRVRIDELRGARGALAGEIEHRFTDYAQLVNPKPATIEEARASLRPGEALIATYVAENATYVWAVPHQGTVAFAEVPLGRERMKAVVTDLRRALDPQAATLGDIPDFDVALSHRLYRSLLEPVKDGWQEAKGLLVVAHGALGQLPLSLLVTAPPRLEPEREPLFARYKDVPWLARSYAVTMLPSVASLTTLRRLPAGNPSRRAFAGFGDPWFSVAQAAAAVAEAPLETAALTSRGILAVRGLPVRLRSLPKMDGFDSAELARLPRLPDTRDEVYSIALAMNADLTRDVFTGREANENRVKTMELSGYKVLAFATHGLVPGDLNGLTQPALALTAPEVAGVAGDGLLTMAEILGLRLDADWVVLSACNTASGDGAGAEAVSGLGRAFFYAGTRALLVSNWPVETTSAKALTTDLFRRQSQDPDLTRAEALRQAMIGLMDGPGYVDREGRTVFSYAHPIFWAPFIMIGDPGGKEASS